MLEQKRVRKKCHEHHQQCLGCGVSETPEWRKGPSGPRTLCNACGLLYAKMCRRRRDAEQGRKQPIASTSSTGATATQVTPEGVTLSMLRVELFTSGVRTTREFTYPATAPAPAPDGPAFVQSQSHSSASHCHGQLHPGTLLESTPSPPLSGSLHFHSSSLPPHSRASTAGSTASAVSGSASTVSSPPPSQGWPFRGPTAATAYMGSSSSSSVDSAPGRPYVPTAAIRR